MASFPTTPDEDARLAKLAEYGLASDDSMKSAFDRVTRLLAQLLDVPITYISLIDQDTMWIKSSVGLDAPTFEREGAICSHTVVRDRPLYVGDLTADPRFYDHDMVTPQDGLRAYAGAPLTTSCGLNMGTLCAVDTKPRSLSAKELEALSDLAALVIAQMDSQLNARRAKLAEERLVDAVEALPDGFVIYDRDDRLVFCNNRYREIYRHSAQWIVPGATFESIIRKGVENGQYPDAVGNEEAWIAERVRIHQSPDEPIEQQLPGDRWLRIQERRTRDGGLVGFRFNVTELMRQKRELARLAWTDHLTGALNRGRFLELAEKQLHPNGPRRTMPILLFDIDHFKQINDRYGHPAGDAVLVELVSRWMQRLQPGDLLARFGGEEFCLALASDKGAAEAAESLRRAACELPIAAEGQLIKVTVSIGYAHYRDGEDVLSKTLGRADAALYRAKEAGRNRCETIAA
ncbi:diguanylate cyclase [Nitratireductor mangrovi]|uniref:diguanylate cyclase n=1 Tax=Nitratireductor mangrovi TaxID=2599600 RepID=A0A5B8KUR2_9HYPH|nr:diguanylate cyclase [Nitratireductor mangrovi]QDY99268.1 diguanylate cyclase [Nitratireductor mangrovi]